jgi:hypothetical protein
VKIRILSVVCVAIIITACAVSFSQRPSPRKRGLIVRTAKPYDNVRNIIRGLGGAVTHEYENIDAVAAHVPEDKISSVVALLGSNTVYKDLSASAPTPAAGSVGVALSRPAPVGLSARSAQQLSSDDLARMGAVAEHREGNRGQRIIVAVIDSGVAHVSSLSGSIIGGETFVPEDPFSATSSRNFSHGTQVASLIAGHAAFVLDNSSPLVQALRNNDPGSVIRCPNSRYPHCSSNQSVLPLVGSAPEAKIYAMKVMSSAGGTNESRIIAAMDRLITMKRNYERGRPSVPVNSPCGSEEKPCVYNSLNVQVVNLSVGSATLFAGHELQEELTKRLLEVGITPVVAAGDEGFAAMTGTSPGTGLGSLTVGAASIAARERAIEEYEALTDDDPSTGAGYGKLWRPSTHTQTAWFSARGPTSDGRIDPELITNGEGLLAQGADGTVSLVTGTSFSSPVAAGGAAVLFGAVRQDSATATEVRNALWESANPSVVGDNSRPIDQGRGYLDIAAALRRLRSGNVRSSLPHSDPTGSVVANIRNLGFTPVDFNNNVFTTRIRNLRPGEVAHFFVQTRDEVNQLTVRLRNLKPELPPEQQNQLFGDDLYVRVADAPTHIITGTSQVYVVDEFVFADADFVINEPQTGLVRVAVQGDRTNAGRISADLVIERRKRELKPESAEGRISEGQTIDYQVNVPAGKSNAVFELFWDNDWAAYPTNDLDMIVCPPGVPQGPGCNYSGSSLDSPERVVVQNPAPGPWTVYIVGFTLHTRRDTFKLRATADGERLRAR